VAAYYEASLGELIEHVAQTIDGFRAGKLDAFAADHTLFQYSRSAKELWKFCNLTPVEIAARAILDQPEVDWWERGAPRRP
jgi:hypothetical protein